MTFNIHHGKGMDGKTDLKRILAEIMKSEADIVALQEVDRFQLRSFFRDQVAFLAKGTGMYACFSPSLNFGYSQFGNVILSKWAITSQRIIHMKGGLERRSILSADIKVNKDSGREMEITVINTHLGVRAQEYIWQMPILCKTIANLTRPAIVLGDFNMEPKDKTMQLLDPHWHRISLEHPQATMKNGKQIDHIFANGGYENARAWVQKTISSDHHAVIAELPHFLQ